MLNGLDWNTIPPVNRHIPATPDRLEMIYNQQLRNASYQKFLHSTNVTVFGTIDDHDMGMNNADVTYEYKRESGIKFLDFIGMSPSNVMYKRAEKGMGVYGIQIFDFDSKIGRNYLVDEDTAAIDPDIIGYQKKERGHIKRRRFAIIVLDVRTFKTPWSQGIDGYRANYDGDFLGETQWKWLDYVLEHSNAEVNIIVNGIQVHPFRHPNSNLAENWSQFPRARQRLYDSILQSGVNAPLLVSGDIHMAQIMRKDCWLQHKEGEPTATRPLIEFTSSGMTHSWGTCFASTSKFHTTWMYYPFHFLSKTIMLLAHFILPMPDLLNSNNARTNSGLFENGGKDGAKKGKQYSLELNFGEIEFDWDNGHVIVRAVGIDRSPLLSASYTINQLSGLQKMPGAIENIASHVKRGAWLRDGRLVDGKYTCLNHRGSAHIAHIVAGVAIETFWAMTLLLSPLIFIIMIINWALKRQRANVRKTKIQ